MKRHPIDLVTSPTAMLSNTVVWGVSSAVYIVTESDFASGFSIGSAIVAAGVLLLSIGRDRGIAKAEGVYLSRLRDLDYATQDVRASHRSRWAASPESLSLSQERIKSRQEIADLCDRTRVAARKDWSL